MTSKRMKYFTKKIDIRPKYDIVNLGDMNVINTFSFPFSESLWDNTQRLLSVIEKILFKI